MTSLQKVPGSVNKISPKLEKYLIERPLKGIVKYRMLNGTVNIDPKAVKGKDDILFPSITQLTLTDKIKDPETGSFVTIGVLKAVDEKGVNHTFKTHFVPGSSRGLLVLHEGITDEEEMYPILELLNSNGSNPFRMTNEKPLFERIDKVKEDNVTLARNNKLFRAWQALDLMSMEDKRIFHSANGGSMDDAEETVNANLQELAKADPDKFYIMVDSPATQVKALVKQANERNIVQYDAQQHKYQWVGGDTIVTLNRTEGMEPLAQFAEWLSTSKDGGQIQLQIKNLLAPAEEKKKK